MKNLDTKVIIVCADTLRPMSWVHAQKQICYIDPLKLTSQRSKGFAVKTYKRCDALLLIKADHDNSHVEGREKHRYMLMLAEHGKC